MATEAAYGFDLSGKPVAEVGVVGSVNRDAIHHPDGRRRDGLGGILFTACALTHLGHGRLRTRLFARLATELAPTVEALLQDVPGIELVGLQLDGPGYHCQIRYDDSGGKSEILTGDVPPLTTEELAPWVSSLDAVLVNFITGFELEFDTLLELRERVNGPILMDIHSLTLGRDGEGRRFPRRPDRWSQWASAVDLVQMNAEEARTLGAPGSTDGLGSWAASLLDLGPKVAVITLGSRGALCAYRAADGSTRHLQQPAEPVTEGGPFDTTGCGDVFLAGMAAGLLTGSGVPAAVALATRAAARNCTLTCIDDLHRLARV